MQVSHRLSFQNRHPKQSPSMTKLFRIGQTLFLPVVLALSSTACSTNTKDDSKWLLGTWEKTADEDNGPPDSITFRVDGTFVTYDKQCKEHANDYFVEKDMVFLVIPLAKGPVALVLQPASDRSSMSFTSPRTQNRATYVPSKTPHCRPRS